MQYNPFSPEQAVPIGADAPSTARPGLDGATAGSSPDVTKRAAAGGALARQIADIFVGFGMNETGGTSGAPPSLPPCDSIDTVLEAVALLNDSPLSFGFGVTDRTNMLSNVWADYFSETVERWREAQHIGASQAAKLTLDVPPHRIPLGFFRRASGLDVTINGDVDYELAQQARFSRFAINGDIQTAAQVGVDAKNCKFDISGSLSAPITSSSFKDAQNLDIHIHGRAVNGNIGKLVTSKIVCDTFDKNSIGEVQGGTVCNVDIKSIVHGMRDKVA